MKAKTTKGLRRQAIAATLFEPTTLKGAIERLGFVQCDPIRAPARAQDLILRQRVKDYRSGDLERQYPQLGLEEDFLYAYGVVSEATWRLLHPRPGKRLTKREEQVRELVYAHSQMHPRDLEVHLGRSLELNAWGSYSKATTMSLETLHYRGMLRVVGREKGIRLYQAAREQKEYLPPEERLKRLILLIARILTPVPERSLRSTLRLLGHGAPGLTWRVHAYQRLIESGELQSADVDGVRYVWPDGEWLEPEPPALVRFLAPFDPLVWDRSRFEHLWGWPYRFEAYTPPAKRKMGYYAMPMLWGAEVVGWVNVSNKEGGTVVEPGFVKAKPTGRAFRAAFADEVERLKEFLKAG